MKAAGGKSFARILMLSQENSHVLLCERALREICEVTGGRGGIFYVTDGCFSMIKSAVGIMGDLAGKPIPSQNHDHAFPKGADENVVNALVWIPIDLGALSVGSLAVLPREGASISESSLKMAEQKGRKLMLMLHHCISFPDLASFWLEWESDFSSSRSKPTVFPKSRDVLPKGISRSTLGRVREFVRRSRKLLSRRDLAEALGFSKITAGTYLGYLTQSGELEEQVLYGKVGRPTFVYRLRSEPSDIIISDKHERTDRR